MSSRPGVCLFTDSREPSGVGEHMLTLAAGLRDRGCRVTLACAPAATTGPLLPRAEALGVEAVALDFDRQNDGRTPLARWLGTRRLDVLHIHAGIGWEGLPAAVAGRAASAHVVVRTEHLPYLLTDPRERAEHAAMLPHLDRLVCVSEAARASFAHAGVRSDLLAVVRNGIEPRRARHDRASVRAALGLKSRDLVVLTVARLAEQKDHRTLLAAVPSVLAIEPDARFLWVGAGPLGQVLREAIRRERLERRVLLLGQRDDVPDLLAAADVFALPSRFEGLPLAVLEAMAAGLPVVAARAPGTAEVVEHGRTGFLVEPGDPEGLAGALALVLADRDRAAAFGAAGRTRVAAEFGAARMAEETFSLYRELLAR